MTMAKDLHAGLMKDLGSIDSELKAKLKAMRDDTKASVLKFRSRVDDYFLTMCAEADAPWKLKEIENARQRLDSHLDKAGTDEDRMLDMVANALGEINSVIGWVLPAPVDPAVVEAVKKRDRAQDMAERQPRGVGIRK